MRVGCLAGRPSVVAALLRAASRLSAPKRLWNRYDVAYFAAGAQRSYCAVECDNGTYCVAVKFPGESWAPCSPGHDLASATASCDRWAAEIR